MTATIRVGTCSWADKTLLESGRFYPADVVKNPRKRLAYYASQFPIVEVDSSYYAIPAAETASGWVEATPDDFVFDIKAFALFTGHGASPKALPKAIREALPPAAREKRNVYAHDFEPGLLDRLYREFEDGLLPLDSAGKLGVVLFQFAPWFVPNGENRAALKSLRERLPQFDLACEFRNRMWMEGENDRDRTLGLLRDQGIAYVCVDEPQGFKSSVPPVAAATADVAVVRFHGRNAAMWERKTKTAAERFDYDYSEAEFREWLPRIEALAAEARELHLLMNNCHEDKGVNDAYQLGALLREAGLVTVRQGPGG
jgi:uncharacterized protein YecE (DUF72 family)